MIDVNREFNELVNMIVLELEDWLIIFVFMFIGWVKDDGLGESIGYESGRYIVEILS